MTRAIKAVLVWVGIIGMASMPLGARADEQPVHYHQASGLAIYGGVDFQLLAEDKEPNTIYLKNMLTDKESTLWTGGGNISEVQPSPDFSKVAFRQYTPAADGWTMHVIDLDGKELGSVEHVYKLCWSPGSESIAYITGVASEGGMGFQSTGVYVYDVSGNRASAKLYESGYDINWPNFDKSIYILDIVDEDSGERVFRLDPTSKAVDPTNHHGIHFSPNGEMYYRPGYHGTEFAVYKSDSDRAVDLSTNTRGLEETEHKYAQPTGWLDDGTLVFPSDKPGNDIDYVMDVEKGETTRSLEGSRVMARPRGGTGMVIVKDGKVELQEGTTRSLEPIK